MTDDMMMGERDLEAEVKEKEEIIMSLRLNEHLLKDKLEISRRNMSKQLERITALEKENNELKKYKKYCAEWMGVKEENLSLRCVKMSERFYIHYVDDFNKHLMDTESDFNIHIEEVDGDEELLIQLCDLLNKQQARIEELKTYNLQHFLEWLVIKGFVIDEQMKDINNVIACVNEFNEYVTEFEKELLDNGR